MDQGSSERDPDVGCGGALQNFGDPVQFIVKLTQGLLAPPKVPGQTLHSRVDWDGAQQSSKFSRQGLCSAPTRRRSHRS